ncbi:hypothetical protein ACE6H2_013840 [Prunus campanulata]
MRTILRLSSSCFGLFKCGPILFAFGAFPKSFHPKRIKQLTNSQKAGLRDRTNKSSNKSDFYSLRMYK